MAKYADHSPLYRQAQIYARQGVALDRSTLADWSGRAAWWLRPLQEKIMSELRASPKLFADETTVPVLDPGRGRTKTGQLWAYARGDRPWGGPAPPAVAYIYAPDRKAERPIAHLEGFRGILQVDGYAGYRALAERGHVRLAFCWAHVHRRFYEIAAAGAAPITTETLARIAELYAIEAEIRGRAADEHHAVRARRAKPIVDDLKIWFETNSPWSRRRALSQRRSATPYRGGMASAASSRMDTSRSIPTSSNVRSARSPLIERTHCSPAPMAAAIIGPSSLPSLRAANSTTSIQNPISPTCSPASSPIIPPIGSTNCCLRNGPKLPTLKGPRDTAYL